jgi:two-component sensor histidine kinase/HAMP domain-containing protein
VYFGNPQGGLVNAGREGPGGSGYVIRTEKFRQGPFRKYAIDEQGVKTSTLLTIADFDARTRPWYQKATTVGQATWTDPFVLATGQDKAISAVRPVYVEDGTFLGVFSVDVFLSQLNAFLTSMNGTLGGFCFITDKAGSLIASSSVSGEFEAIAREGQKAVHSETHGQFTLKGERYYVNTTPLSETVGLDWIIITVYPENVFMSKINENDGPQYLVLGLVLLACILLTVQISRVFSKPVLRLTEYTQRLSKGEWPGELPPMAIYEMENLRKSFDAMQGELKLSIERLNGEIQDKNSANELIRKLLAEKELLLREVHHRIKNNMNVIVSLFSLQSGMLDDERPKRVLLDAQTRMESMMLLYDKLYRSDSFTSIDAARYFSEILDQVHLHFQKKSVLIENHLESLTLHSDQLMPLGIIVNELLTNAYKYAFPSGGGTIFLGLEKQGSKIVVTVCDDGVGYNPSSQTASTGFGTQVVSALVGQIGGTLSIDGTKGTRVIITLPTPLS